MCRVALLQVRGEISIKRLDSLIQEDVQVRCMRHTVPGLTGCVPPTAAYSESLPALVGWCVCTHMQHHCSLKQCCFPLTEVQLPAVSNRALKTSNYAYLRHRS